MGGPFGLSVGAGGEVITLVESLGFGWMGLVEPSTGELLARVDPDPQGPYFVRFPTARWTAWVADRDGGFHCLCLGPGGEQEMLVRLRTDLTVAWTVPAPGAVGAEPAVGADGSAYFIDGEEVVAVNEDGSVRWSRPKPSPGSPVGQSPTLSADGTLYVPLEKEVLALDSATGEEVWRADLREIEAQLDPISDSWGAVMAPAVADDGTIYVSVRYTENGVVALWGPSPLADAPWPTYRADNRRSGRVNMGGGG